MTGVIKFAETTHLRLLGTRFLAKTIRGQVEQALQEAESIVLDFEDVTVTQSFIDELLGPLLLKCGEPLLNRLAFGGCSDDVRAVISFVISERLSDFEMRRPPAPNAMASC